MVVYKQWHYNASKKSTPKAAAGMMNYIATRDGVELANLSSTVGQNKYVDYIATRKGVDIGDTEHGLFGKLDGMSEMCDIADLAQARTYVEKLAKNKTNIFNAVISLTEADATRKDLTDKASWSSLVNTHINDIARRMDIPPRTLEWAAAVHLEKGHPHVHIMYWDKEQKIARNFVAPEVCNNIRKDITKALFKDEFAELMHSKDKKRKDVINSIFNNEDSILKNSKNCFHNMSFADVKQLCDATNAPSEKLLGRRGIDTTPIMYALAELDSQIRSEYSKGALKYQFMPTKIKKQLDQLSYEIITGHPDVAREYSSYIDTVTTQAELYGGNENTDKYVKTAKKDLYKDIGNKILQTIKDMRGKTDDAACDSEPPSFEDDHSGDVYETQSADDILSANDVAFEGKAYVKWTDKYKQSRKCLFGDDENPPNFVQARVLLLDEAKTGNALALHDLGKMAADGLGCTKDAATAHQWYKKALAAFHMVEKTKATPYTEYRIGKMYNAGIGTEQNVEKAIKYFELSARLGNQFAQYTLGKLLLKGEQVPPNIPAAINWLTLSAEQGNQFAAQLLMGKHSIRCIDLMQNIFNVIAQAAEKPATNKNKRTTGDMSKAQKAELSKNAKDNSIEWGD